jgi:hypothetical protein
MQLGDDAVEFVNAGADGIVSVCQSSGLMWGKKRHVAGDADRVADAAQKPADDGRLRERGHVGDVAGDAHVVFDKLQARRARRAETARNLRAKNKAKDEAAATANAVLQAETMRTVRAMAETVRTQAATILAMQGKIADLAGC